MSTDCYSSFSKPEQLGVFSSKETAISFIQELLDKGEMSVNEYEVMIEQHEIDHPSTPEIIPLKLVTRVLI